MTRDYHAETAASITALARRIVATMPAWVNAPLTPLRTIKMPPKLKYQFSRDWYVAEFDWVHQGEVLDWCRQQFGPHPQNPDAWSRWCQKFQEKIHFRDEKDYQWFVLRWGA